MNTVWLVLLVFFGALEGHEDGHGHYKEKAYVIDVQPTKELCYDKMEEVWDNMREAYKGDDTYAMKCACAIKEGETYKPCPK